MKTLDQEIAEARAQRAKLQALADAGDPMAKRVVRAMADAEREFLNAAADRIFGEPSSAGGGGLSLLIGDE